MMKSLLDRTTLVCTLWSLLFALCFPQMAQALKIEAEGGLSIEYMIDVIPDDLFQLSRYDPGTHRWIYTVKVPYQPPGGNATLHVNLPPRDVSDPAFDSLMGVFYWLRDNLFRYESTVHIDSCYQNAELCPDFCCSPGAMISLGDVPLSDPPNRFSLSRTTRWWEPGWPVTKIEIHVGDKTPGHKYIAILEIVFLTGSKDIATLPSLKGTPADNPYTDFEGGCQNPGAFGLPNYAINTSTLNLVVQDTDFSYRAPGQNVSFARTWNADPLQKGMFGKGWGFSYESTIRSYGSYSGSAQRIKGSGQVSNYRYSSHTTDGEDHVTTFTPTAQNSFDSLTGYFSAASSYFILKEKDSKLTFRYDYKEREPSGAETYRLVSISDRNGNAIQIGYNADGALASVTDAVSRTTTFSYDENKRCTAMTVPDGRTATYAYDASGNMVRNADLLGTLIDYAYDAKGYMTSLSYAGKTTLFEYDTSGGWTHLSAVTDANGNRRTYQATSDGNTSTTDSLGVVTSRYSEKGLTMSRSIGSVAKMSTQFQNGLPVSITDGKFNQTKLEYDSNGNITKVISPGFDGFATTYAYDATGNLVSVSDPFGKTGTFVYDEKGNLVKSTSPMGKEKTYTYDARGLMTAFKDEKDRTSLFTYDSFGNLKTTKDPAGGVTTMDYDALGFNMVSQTDPLGRVTRMAYDHNGRITRITNSDGSYKTYTHDACSVISMRDENGNISAFERNNLCAITRLVDPMGNSTSVGYDINNHILSSTNPLGQTTAMTYDAAGRPIEIRKPSGEKLTSSFDSNGNLLLLKDERSKATDFTYDANNRTASIRDPLGRTIKYARDAIGRITKITNPDNASVTYAYDDDGMMISKNSSAGGSVAFQRDPVGNITSVHDAGGITTFTYNGVDQVASITYPDKLSVSFTYDEAGNKRSVVYPGGLVVSYAYDDRNRVSSASWGAGSSFTRHYDPAGNLLKTVRSNGTESSYTYDRNDRVVHIVHRKGTDSFADMAYKRNARGNTIEETTDLPLSHPLADAATAATYNDANQMTAWGDGAYTYDAQGNMTTVTGAASMHVVYDVENRPLSMTRNGATTTYAYNGLGLRTQATSGSKTRHFHHDARGRLLFETDGDGNVTAWYIYSGISLTAMVTSTGETCYYHFDKTGNTLALTDGSGRVVSSYVYEPFGRIANQTGTVPNSFTYVGELGVMDEGSNLYFMMHRYYDAETERFIQKDPVGIAGGVNLYAYVVNNPVDRVDPSGLLGPEGSLSEQRFLDLATAPETRNAREAMGRTVLGVGEGLTTVPFTSYSLGRGVRRLAGHLLGIDTSVDENTWSYWTGNLAGQLGQMVACGGATAAYKSFDTGGKALCYTGSYGTSALALARLEALKTGAVLLEATPGGRLLNYVNSNLITVPDRIWEVASALYALNARSQGQLTVFIGSAAKEGQGIYYTTEKVILRRFGVALKEVFVH